MGATLGAKRKPSKKWPPTMPLSDVKIKAAKPGPKPVKVADSGGLFLLVQPSGGKLWRFKYRINGKEKKLSLGRYPDVPLQEARRRRDEARAVVALGKDPAEERKQAQLEIIAQSANSFERVAEEYLTKVAAEGREAVTIKKSRWLLSLLASSIGDKPVGSIKPAELLAAIKPVPMHPDLREALARHHRETGNPSAGPLIASERGGHMTPRSIVNWFHDERIGHLVERCLVDRVDRGNKPPRRTRRKLVLCRSRLWFG